MESKDILKESDIKNRTCYYFDDIMRDWDRNIDIIRLKILKGKIRKDFNF